MRYIFDFNNAVAGGSLSQQHIVSNVNESGLELSLMLPGLAAAIDVIYAVFSDILVIPVAPSLVDFLFKMEKM